MYKETYTIPILFTFYLVPFSLVITTPPARNFKSYPIHPIYGNSYLFSFQFSPLP